MLVVYLCIKIYSMQSVLTTHRLAYLCWQCDASLEMKLALGSVVKEWAVKVSLIQSSNMKVVRVAQIPKAFTKLKLMKK